MGKKDVLPKEPTCSEFPKFFEGNLKFLLKLHGISIKKLSEELDVGEKMMYLYYGGNDPMLKVARKFTRYFKLTLDELFETDLRNSPKFRIGEHSDNATETGGRSSPTPTGETTESPPQGQEGALEEMVQREVEKALSKLRLVSA